MSVVEEIDGERRRRRRRLGLYIPIMVRASLAWNGIETEDDTLSLVTLRNNEPLTNRSTQPPQPQPSCNYRLPTNS